ncbi:isoafricanol synthase [Streptomyces sp. 7N604]|uniref:isoafricanol synthase n=1 Tax=Streptomyces sp. 7N604 TaxID=3457415 RepID=UPI003FD19B63
MTHAMDFGQQRTPPDPTRRAAAIRIPFPARLSPHAERARRHTLQWLQEMGMLTGAAAAAEYDTLRLERLMAYFYPDATGTDLELAADFNAWFFIFDDQFDGCLGLQPEAIEQVVASIGRTMAADDTTLPAPGNPAPPLVRGFRNIWHRATAGRPAAWQRRFRAHWQTYLAAHQGEAHHRTADRLPSLQEFLRVRRESIGVQPCLDFTERCGGYTLPDELHEASPLAKMREITADVVIFVNDIVSLVKELAAGEVNNSVIILREQTGRTLEQSVERIAALANTRAARFVRLSSALPKILSASGVLPEVRGHVDHYVSGMGNLMAGNLAWSLATARYDETGVAAVSRGRQRPWAHLTETTSGNVSR